MSFLVNSHVLFLPYSSVDLTGCISIVISILKMLTAVTAVLPFCNWFPSNILTICVIQALDHDV